MRLASLLTSCLALSFQAAPVRAETPASTPPLKERLLQFYKEFFPFGYADPISVSRFDHGSVNVCNSLSHGCSVVTLPGPVNMAKRFVPGPFVEGAAASWLALDHQDSYLCSVAEGERAAACARMAGFSASGIHINFMRRHIVPILHFSSSSDSDQFVAKYAKSFYASLAKASELLKLHMAENKPAALVGALPVKQFLFDVPGAAPQPEDGNGGAWEVPVGGGSETSVEEAGVS
ncbi:hypothetical protein MJ904_22210 [Massilia sp. MB5]|uniref:hypothetical protein n=1 Tax=Massilia sp. MB5 TaxID=2919578 RepID=UPI001F114B45|nr:hypothetical protein [Massilia sp. MB5]UMR29727.1 hypothetical protein MJ904_22210 [Massilia sp. MB5]